MWPTKFPTFGDCVVSGLLSEVLFTIKSDFRWVVTYGTRKLWIIIIIIQLIMTLKINTTQVCFQNGSHCQQKSYSVSHPPRWSCSTYLWNNSKKKLTWWRASAWDVSFSLFTYEWLSHINVALHCTTVTLPCDVDIWGWLICLHCQSKKNSCVIFNIINLFMYFERW